MRLDLEKLARETDGLDGQVYEDILYSVAMSELEYDIAERITWKRALAEAGGDQDRAALAYPALRVRRLISELENYRKAEIKLAVQKNIKKTKSFFKWLVSNPDETKSKIHKGNRSAAWDKYFFDDM